MCPVSRLKQPEIHIFLLRAGATGYTRHHFSDRYLHNDPVFDFKEDLISSRLFVASKPDDDLQLNLFRWMHMDARATYQFVQQLEDDPATEELSGVSTNIKLMYRWRIQYSYCC
jgi:hypothetical protein